MVFSRNGNEVCPYTTQNGTLTRSLHSRGSIRAWFISARAYNEIAPKMELKMHGKSVCIFLVIQIISTLAIIKHVSLDFTVDWIHPCTFLHLMRWDSEVNISITHILSNWQKSTFMCHFASPNWRWIPISKWNLLNLLTNFSMKIVWMDSGKIREKEDIFSNKKSNKISAHMKIKLEIITAKCHIVAKKIIFERSRIYLSWR